MNETYTFTARSAEDARHVATFTLFDHQMAVDSGEHLVHAGLIYDDENGDNALLGADLAQGLQQWAQPVGSWLIQRAVQPFDINDVKARAGDNGLAVRAWVRTGGRRVAPLVFRWQEVDNPVASVAFVEEVRRRKAESGQSGGYPGPLDYWVTWLAVPLFAVLFLMAVARFFLGGGDDDAQTGGVS